MIERRILLAAAAIGLGGCGFRPLYGRSGSAGTVVRPELASIFVGVMSERTGQLLRQALQERLTGADDDAPKQYELVGSLSVATEAIGIQQDTSSTRVRFNGVGNWTLRRLDAKNTLVLSGVARAVDGLNVSNQEYFAVDLETSAAYRKLAEQIADKITLDLAAYFRTHPTAA